MHRRGKKVLSQASHEHVPFLGRYVTRHGIKVNHMKTATVHELPTTHTVEDVRAFLPLVSYYFKLCLCGNPPWWVWQRKMANSYGIMTVSKPLLHSRKLWFSLQSYHILHEMALLLIVLSTDANDTWMGAVLDQEQMVAGRMVKRVIAYAWEKKTSTLANSATLPPIKNYSQHWLPWTSSSTTWLEDISWTDHASLYLAEKFQKDNHSALTVWFWHCSEAWQTP